MSSIHALLLLPAALVVAAVLAVIEETLRMLEMLGGTAAGRKVSMENTEEGAPAGAPVLLL